MSFKYRLSISIMLLFPVLLTGQTSNALEVRSTSDFTIGEQVTCYSKWLEEERVLNIFLPQGYHPDSTQKYHVIYLLDGSKEEDFIHVAGLVQFVTFPWVKQLPPTIVVGIGNVDRKRDFTYPSNDLEDQKYLPTSGGSAPFIRFLSEEVIPFVEANYVVDTISTLIGQSLGGLLASEILIDNAQLFDHYIIISPSLWWDGSSLLKRPFKQKNHAVEAYVAVGKEGPVMENTAMELALKLKKAGIETTFDYFGAYDHANIMHETVYKAFKVLFKGKAP